MEQAKITFVIDGNTYSLCATDTASIREIPAADRRTLIALLESVKQQDSLANTAIEAALNKAQPFSQPTALQPDRDSIYPGTGAQGERLGSGDVDALMARLVMEEEKNRKPGLTTQGIYKILGGFAVIVFLLVLIL